MPTGRFDIALHVPSLAEQVWHGVDLGTRGARLDVADAPGLVLEGAIEPASARVLLMPRLMGAHRGMVDVLRARLAITGVQGTFRFPGLRRGAYSLVIDVGFEPYHVVAIDLGEDLDLGTINVPRAVSVPILLDPFLTIAGRPWRVRLSARDVDGSAGQRGPIDVEADAFGFVEIGPIPVGDYVLELLDERGSKWLTEDLRVEDSAALDVTIPHVVIAGRVASGDAPAHGVLVFGTGFGEVAIEIPIDENGRFEGYLPEEGWWQVDWEIGGGDCSACGAETSVQLPEVLVEAGPSGKAILALDIPGTRLAGRVVRPSGRGLESAPAAWVTVIGSGSEPGRAANEARTRTDEDGRFDLWGVFPGTHHVVAASDDGDAESAVVPVQVAERGTPPEIELILREYETVSLSLRSADGPVAAASLLARAAPGGSSLGRKAWSGGDGEASVRVLAGTRALDLVITHPAYATWLGRVPVDSRQPPVVVLEPKYRAATLRVDLPERSEGIDFSTAGYLAIGGVRFRHGELFAAKRELLGQSVDGGFQITDLSPGAYTYCWTIPVERCRRVVLPPAGVAVADLTEPRPPALAAGEGEGQ